MKARLLYRCNDRTGESVIWLPALGVVLWVDIDRGILHQYDCGSGQVKDFTFPDLVSAIVPWKGREREVILAMKNRLIIYHLTSGTFRTLAELPGLSPVLRTNDCKASPEGRLWCGVMHISEHQGNGSLYCMEDDLSMNQVLERQCIPNGMVWNRAGDRMYYADSGRGCIEEYAYDRLTGAVFLLRTAVQVPPEYGVPDGMTIDGDGCLWVAHWGGAGVYVWNPATGRLMDKVDVPAPYVSSCTFGGPKGNQLFITTALSGLSAEERERWPLSGSLFVADVPGVVPGENHYPFCGTEK